MIETKEITTDFTKGNIPQQLFKFATPLFLSSMLQVVYNMVDMIIVGNSVGDVGLSAVAVGGDISNMMLFLGMGFANAGQVIIAQYLGAGKKEQIGRFIATMTTFLVIASITLSIIGIIFCKVFLNWMNTPQEAFSQALSYSNICITGMVFIYGYNVMSAVLRGLGDSRHPFVFISIASVSNIILDIIFVIVFSLGAPGAALATVISQCASFILSVIFLYRNRKKLGFEIRKYDFFHIDKAMLNDLTKLGIPMAIKSASIHFSKLFVNSWINSYGVVVSAFAGVANKVNSISNLMSNALNTAGSSMVGQNIGAKTYNRVPKIALTIAGVTLTIATIVSVLIYSFPNQIFGIFSKEEGILTIAQEYLPIAVVIFFASALRAPANAVINGSGNYKINFATALLDGIILRIGLSVLFGLGIKMKYLGFWLGDALAGYTPMIIGLIFYLSGNWKNGQKTKIEQ